jgi:hypothetical protein
MLVGVLALGSLLSAISNSISLVSPRVTYIASAFLIVTWVFFEFTFMMFRLPWLAAHGVRVRLIAPGVKPRLCMIGVLALLWVPRFGDLLRAGQGVPQATLKLVNNSDEDVAVSQRGEFVVWFPNATFDGAPRVPGTVLLLPSSVETEATNPIIVQRHRARFIHAKVLNERYFAPILDRDDSEITFFLHTQHGLRSSNEMPFRRSTFAKAYLEVTLQQDR